MSIYIKSIDSTRFEEFFDMLKAMHDEEHAANDTVCGNPTTNAHKKRLQKDLGKKYHACIAAENGNAVGFAQWYEGYAGIAATPILYLENIYVKPQARGRGIAEKLFKHVKREARGKKCARIDWVTLRENTASQKFYKKLGAAPDENWLTYRQHI